MKIYLTFDVEIWCGGWSDLDRRFPASFDRYVYGRSPKGDYALPKTLEILDRHGLKGVFFVEPLFAARFGVDRLATIVNLIRAGGHDIQLHLHPEWTDEIRPLPFVGATVKRQHLSYYTLDEQVALLTMGLDLLAQVGCSAVTAFRAGSFACNHDTYHALRQVGIGIDSSLHAVLPHSGPDLRDKIDFLHPLEFEQIRILPMTVFRDGLGKRRPAQVGACSFAEMRDAIESAVTRQAAHFVILSHNFEMLKPGLSEPDRFVVARFEALCRYLGDNRGRLTAATLSGEPIKIGAPIDTALADARWPGTLWRLGEQAMRRVI